MKAFIKKTRVLLSRRCFILLTRFNILYMYRLNHLLQIQEIKIELHKSGEQEKCSEHDVNKVFHVKEVSRQYPPVNRYLVRDALCRTWATASLTIIIG